MVLATATAREMAAVVVAAAATAVASVASTVGLEMQTHLKPLVSSFFCIFK